MSAQRKNNEGFITGAQLEEEIKKCLDLIRERCELRHGKEESDLVSITHRLGDARTSLEASNQNLKDAIATLRETTNNKLESIDKAFRGNGKTGVYEEIRWHTFQIRILFVIAILLVGFKFYGLGLKDLAEEWIIKKHTPAPAFVSPVPNHVPTAYPGTTLTPVPHPTVVPNAFPMIPIPGP